MKKVLLFIAILFFFDRFGQAQSLTIEYNIGHGSYQMSDMKDILKINYGKISIFREYLFQFTSGQRANNIF